MNICKQGNGHYIDGINNQDFSYYEDGFKLVTDGCSGGKFSEVGTRLFIQYLTSLEGYSDVTKFEENVEITFSKIISLFGSFSKEKMDDFIADNMLFTIIACFEMEDKFVVKFIGDGFIITVNSNNMVSYIRLNFGKAPPYFAYNLIDAKSYDTPLEFKTFEFNKKDFKNVGIASDGIAPIAERKIEEDFDTFILGQASLYSPEGVIKAHKTSFYDDVTIVI